ncbi:MAG TPA: rRNA maturation RNase YbeY [Polyangia bacterium]|jgi:rRNA maturation RNase YbeY
MAVNLTVEPGARAALGAAAAARLRRRAQRALTAAGEAAADLSILLCDDARIRELNGRYADEDHATDVLSFSQREGLDSPQPGLLGDVAVSVETAARQAAERPGPRGAALEAEVLHLVVHGLAHLLGYDHDTEARRRVMWEREAGLREQALGRGAVRPA